MTHADRAIRALLRTPWAITEAKLEEILGFLEAHQAGERLSEAEARERFGAARGTSPRTLGQIAVIPIYGTLVPRANLMTAYSGGTSVQQLAANFRAAVENDDVAAIVLDVDSPGGSVSGIEEMAQQIRKARGAKPIHAVANFQMASAAYYLGAQADEVVVSPSAEAGSIGVFMIHTDVSAAAEKAGVKHTVIKAGRYKAEGHPYAPLGEEAEAALQAEVNEFYDLFVAAVAKGRNVKESAVRNGFGEGRCLSAKRAVQEGLADRVATLDEVIDGLRSGKGGGRKRATTVISAGMPRAAAAEPVEIEIIANELAGTPQGGTIAIDADAPLPEVNASAYAEGATPLPLLRATAPAGDRTDAAKPYLVPLAAEDHSDGEHRTCPECGAPMEAGEDGAWTCVECGYTEGDAESNDDEKTGQDAGGAAAEANSENPATQPAPGAKETPVANPTTAATGTPGAVTTDDVQAATQAAIAAERERARQIRGMCAEHGIDAAKATAWIDEGKSESEVQGLVLQEIRNRAAAAPTLRVGADREAEKPFDSFGEQLLAIRAAAAAGATPDSRLGRLNAVAGAGSQVPSDGGFLIQQDFAGEILRRSYELGQISSRVRRVPISAGANGLKMNAVDESSRANGSRYGGVQVYWENEGDTAAAKKPKFRQMELNLRKLLGIMYATDELLEDATALEAVATDAFAEEINFKVEDGVFRGSGAGQMFGILNSDALVTVAKESGQTAATVNVQNITKMFARLWSRSRLNAAWFINQDVEPQLQTMTLGDQPIYLPPGGLRDSPYGTMLGRPVIPVEYCETVGTVGDVVLADLSQYLMIDKGGVEQAWSIHVRFVYGEQTFRITYRVDGQPIWNTALTPFKGSNTLSPFVALATRS